MDHGSGGVDPAPVPTDPAPAAADVPPAAPGDGDHRLAKKRDKVRAAWIAFAGRILAQLIGAIATVLLGIYVVRTYGVGDRTSTPSSSPARSGRSTPAQMARLSVVVLPFLTHGPDRADDAYLADGVTEALIADLSHLEDLRVISRTSSMAYRDSRKTAPQIASELGVDFIVEGSLVRDRDRLRVSAQLVDARTDDDLWSGRYDRTVRDVLAVQAEVATAIALHLHAVISPRQEQARATLLGIDPAAYDAYLRGRQAFHRRTPADLQLAVRHFREAVQRTPRFAMAHAALAETHGLLALDAFGATDAKASLDAAEREAQAALAIDDANADAHLAIAMVRHRRDWDWAGAEGAFRRTLALHESHPTAHQWFAIFLAEQRRSAEAVTHADRAVALDPASAPVARTAGLVRLYAGALGDAQPRLERALGLAPDDGVSRLMLASLHLAARRPAQARALVLPMRDASLEDQRLAMLLHAAAIEGDQPAVRRWRAAFEARPAPRSLVAEARVQLALGDADGLIAVATRAVAARTQLACALRVHPVFASVRQDPRLLSLAERAGVP